MANPSSHLITCNPSSIPLRMGNVWGIKICRTFIWKYLIKVCQLYLCCIILLIFDSFVQFWGNFNRDFFNRMTQQVKLTNPIHSLTNALSLGCLWSSLCGCGVVSVVANLRFTISTLLIMDGQVWRAVRSRWKESAVGFTPVNSGPWQYPQNVDLWGGGGVRTHPVHPLATGLPFHVGSN